MPNNNSKKKPRPKKGGVLEYAKSNRSKCAHCGEIIEKGALRLGAVTFYPRRHCRWHHYGPCMRAAAMGATLERVWGLEEIRSEEVEELGKELTAINAVVIRHSLPSITGNLDMPRFADAITGRYNRFRSFRFGLPETEKYSANWNWRCFMATILVSNTHESAMLRATEALFTVYPTPEALVSIREDRKTQKAWMDWMEARDVRHVGKKVGFLLKTTQTLLDKYDGKVPNDREALEAMPGVGRHVASISMAWIHQAPEFGIDTHVTRILERWGYIEEGCKDREAERRVKELIPEKQIGHFSRAFVDHGQQVCGFTPDCQNCFLRASCPTAAKYAELEWYNMCVVSGPGGFFAAVGWTWCRVRHDESGAWPCEYKHTEQRAASLGVGAQYTPRGRGAMGRHTDLGALSLRWRRPYSRCRMCMSSPAIEADVVLCAWSSRSGRCALACVGNASLHVGLSL